jgi:hypothetical protein
VPSPPPPAPSAFAQLRVLVIVVAIFFLLPAVLFFRLSGNEGGTRTAVMVLALILPATGAMILQRNPDLLPERHRVRALQPLEWVNLAALAALLATGAWWLAGALGA